MRLGPCRWLASLKARSYSDLRLLVAAVLLLFVIGATRTQECRHNEFVLWG
jgi:hypothetical protein